MIIFSSSLIKKSLNFWKKSKLVQLMQVSTWLSSITFQLDRRLIWLQTLVVIDSESWHAKHRFNSHYMTSLFICKLCHTVVPQGRHR